MATRGRSPNYPAIPLGDLLVNLERYVANEGRAPVDVETAAKALGYSGLNGAARTRMGAMKQYGLLQGRDDAVKISDLGLRIAFPSSDDDKREALREAALAPDLFRELYDSYPDSSPDAVKAYLIRVRQFTPDGASLASRSFKQTMDFAGVGSKRLEAKDVVATATVVGGSEAVAPSGASQPLVTVGVASAPTNADSTAAGASTLQLVIPFAGRKLSVSIAIEGVGLERAHIAKIRRHLELIEEDLEADTGG